MALGDVQIAPQAMAYPISVRQSQRPCLHVLEVPKDRKYVKAAMFILRCALKKKRKNMAAVMRLTLPLHQIYASNPYQDYQDLARTFFFVRIALSAISDVVVCLCACAVGDCGVV